MNMEDLCTGCLCAGRKLVLLQETEYYHIYSQILNEIPVYNLSTVVIRICWECRAVLRRIRQFKEQVKRSYIDLMQCTAYPAAPRLTAHTLDPPTPMPVKSELSVEVDIKSEPDIDDDVSGAAFADRLSLDHCDVEASEPEPEKPKKKVKLKKSGKKIKRKKKKRKRLVKEADLEEEGDIADDVGEGERQTDVEEEMQAKPEDNAGTEGAEVHGTAKFPEPQLGVAKWSAGVEPATLARKEATLVNDKPKCEDCGKMFSSKKTYRYHINVLHKGNNQYPCPRCGKVYQWKSNLGRHMRTHKAVDAGELYCALCDKSFASVATYRQHLKISRRHVTENDFTFVCNECGKKFVNKTRLRDHIDWEHLKKIKFRCQLCNKAFKCHTSLYVHTQNVHRDKEKKDNLCHVCGKSYQNAAKLKYHITAMHSGASPYRCGECGAAFGWYSSLYRHLRELHYKMKVQPKKAKKSKKVPEALPPMLPSLYPMQPPG